MRYEPVGYIYEYEIGALVVFMVIMLRYFSARRFPNQKTRLFSLVLWATVTDVLLDIVSSLIIDNVFSVNIVVTHVVNTVYYALTVLMLVLMMLYTLALVKYLTPKLMLRYAPLYIPCAIVLFLLAINPLTHWFFYVDPVEGYVHGVLFGLVYIISLAYLVFTFVIAFRARNKLRKDEYQTIMAFLFIVLATVLLQYFYPAVLLTGVAITLAVVLMYFTLENPDTMVDVTTGAFTSEAMITFLHDRVHENERVQIVAVKINNMPRINKLLGIENGSLLLREVCTYMRESAADSWVFRMRGSCFVAITRKKADYMALTKRVDDRIGLPWVIDGTEILLQAAVCRMALDELLPSPLSPEDTVNYIETAFLQSERGGDRIINVAEGAELLNRMERYRTVENALRQALEHGEGLELYFQPLWSVKRQRFVSAEVLLRFRHPELGSIPPDEFVPIAESNGLIMAIDELVVRKACSFMRKHDYFNGLGLDTLEINLSALEFMHHRLPQLLGNIMSHYGVDPGFLCFEVTETAATESFELLKECMAGIQRFGCSFALDDFGMGYANISRVIQLPFSIVKLDKSLLYGPHVVLKDMLSMFAHIDRLTVVEGVETAEQVERVVSCGVDIIQGYYYARPMDAKSFVKFLEENNTARDE